MLRILVSIFSCFILFSSKAQAPVNDECNSAIAVTPTAFGVTCITPTSATTANATTSVPSPSCGAAGADDDIWYTFTAASQSVILKVSNATLIPSGTASVSYELYSGSCGALTSLGCFNGVFIGGGHRIMNNLTIGSTYTLRFWSSSTTADMNFDFCIQTVTPPPSNDECGGAIAITTQPFGTSCTASISANTTGATQSTPNPSCGAGDNNDDIWYTFTANSQSVIIRYTNGLNTINGNFLGLGYALYDGCPTTTTTISCLNPISVLGNGFRIIDGLTIGNTYYLRLFSDGLNNYMSFNFCVQDVPPPPTNNECSGAIPITTQPFGTTCAASISANTTGATRSTPDPSCGGGDNNDDIWYTFTANSQSVILRYTNGLNTVTGSINQGLGYALYDACPASTTTISCLNPISVLGNGFKIIDGLTIGNTYFLRLFSDGVNNYMSFDFCVQDVPPPPSNNECSGAIPITTQPFGTTCAASIAANTSGATHSTPDPSCGVSDSNDDIWYTFTANSQSIIIRYTNGLNTVTGSINQGLGYALYNACPASTTTVSCLSPISVLGNGIKIIDGLTIGNTYYLRLFSDGVNNYMSFDFCVQDVPPPPANDECVNAQPINLTQPGTVCTSTYFVNTTGATQSSPNPNCTTLNNNDDVWYSFTASATSAILRYSGGVLTTSNSIMTLGYAVYNATCPTTTSTVSCLNSFGANSGTVNITGLIPGNAYYIRLFTGGSENYGSFNFCLQTPLQNDECINAINIPVTSGFCINPIVASLSGATTSSGFGVPSCGGTLSRDVWFKATVPATGNLIVQTSAVKATANNTVMVAYSGVCGSVTQVACDNDGNPETPPSANHSRISLTGRTPGEVILYRVLALSTSSEEQFAICAWDETPSVLPQVALGGNCVAGVTKTIDSAFGNLYMWVPIMNNSGEIIAEIYADGNNLGNVNSSVFVNTGAVRTFNSGFYLDRNMTIEVQNQPASNVKLRTYIKSTELSALQAVDPAVLSINDVDITKTNTACQATYTGGGQLLATNNFGYNTDYYLQGNVNSFSSFYVDRTNSVLSNNKIILKATLQSNSILLNWSIADNISVGSKIILQRSTDGINYNDINLQSFVGSLDISYNDYYFHNIIYYRVKIIDGVKVLYSNIAVVKNNNIDMVIYPNPVAINQTINIKSITSLKSIIIFGANGNELFRQQLSSNSFKLPIKLTPGIYLYKIIDVNNVTQMGKLMTH